MALRRQTLYSAHGRRWRVTQVLPGAVETVVTLVAVEPDWFTTEDARSLHSGSSVGPQSQSWATRYHSVMLPLGARTRCRADLPSAGGEALARQLTVIG